MAFDRISITVDSELGAQVRELAERDETSVSRWVAAALDDKVRRCRLGEALVAFERDHGAFTPKELKAARRELGLGPVKKLERGA